MEERTWTHLNTQMYTSKVPCPMSHLISAILLLLLFHSRKSIPCHSMITSCKNNDIKLFIHHLHSRAFSSLTATCRFLICKFPEGDVLKEHPACLPSLLNSDFLNQVRKETK